MKMTKQNDQQDSEKVTDGQELGVSNFLPPFAAEILVCAARVARSLPEGSLQRRREIDDAVDMVRKMFPSRFRR